MCMCVGISNYSTHVHLGKINMVFLLWIFFLLPPQIEVKPRKNIQLPVAVYLQNFQMEKKELYSSEKEDKSRSQFCWSRGRERCWGGLTWTLQSRPEFDQFHRKPFKFKVCIYVCVCVYMWMRAQYNLCLGRKTCLSGRGYPLRQLCTSIHTCVHTNTWKQTKTDPWPCMYKWALLWGWRWVRAGWEMCSRGERGEGAQNFIRGSMRRRTGSWLPEPLWLSCDWRPPIPPGKGPTVTSHVMLWHTGLLVKRAEQVMNKTFRGILLWENNLCQGGVIPFTTPELNISL